MTRKPFEPPPSWDKLCFGLPDDFDFTAVKTVTAASVLIGRLPNPHRGVAAQRLHSQLKIVGKRVVFRGLMAVWDHDHGAIAGSFGSETDFLMALRDVAPPIARTERLQVWRGVNGVGAIDGLSWTKDRDIACWFATRFSPVMPLVFVTHLEPEAVVVEYNGRDEQEVIVDPEYLFDVSLDVPSEPLVSDASSFEVPSATLADWEAARDRYEKQKNDKQKKRLMRLRASLTR
jgi:hypothetical protein